ncbi:SGNH/GDSL hydrolase family protein [Frigoribacterium sp. MEB024]|uniref:SGNH/GDSL hydrolase family protein n=1 Tax=Frigoribacterium sp. MEB024 TaxID=1589899 RepID=UPI0009E3A0D6|nr:SGNH/GDSL hydrolase family protein [Frigoribacterium sp. MEB024]
MGTPRLVSADPDSGKLPDVVLNNLDARTTDAVNVVKGTPSYVTTDTARAARFNPTQSVFNLDPTKLRTARGAFARAAAGTGEARVAFLGDSTVAGNGASPGETDWPSWFRRILAQRGYPIANPGASQLNKDSALLQVDPHMVFASTGWTRPVAASGLMQAAASGGAVTYTSPHTGTVVRIGHNDFGGPFTVQIDGGTAVTVTPGTGDTGRVVREFTGLANTTHVVAVTATTGNVAQVFDIEVGYPAGTTGVSFRNLGIGSTTMEQVNTNSKFGTLQVARAFNPHLVFICSEINGLGGSSPRPLASYKADTSAVVTEALSWGATVVLVTANPVQGLTDNGSYQQYTNALYEVALEKGVALIDHQARWTWAALQAATLMADTAHPNPAGYRELALTNIGALGL